jgi:HD-GYP domain-containing protein (c-di-GMP phosphodiesterase class II)
MAEAPESRDQLGNEPVLRYVSLRQERFYRDSRRRLWVGIVLGSLLAAAVCAVLSVTYHLVTYGERLIHQATESACRLDMALTLRHLGPDAASLERVGMAECGAEGAVCPVAAAAYGRDGQRLSVWNGNAWGALLSPRSVDGGPKLDRLSTPAGPALRLSVAVPSGCGDILGRFVALYQSPPFFRRQILSEAAAAAALFALAALGTGLAIYPFILRRDRFLVSRARALARSNFDLLSVLGTIAALRDGTTSSHNLRVTLYALHIGEIFKLPHQSMVALLKGAFLHDIGKVAIHDAILLKPGPLTPEERVEMNRHVSMGEDIVHQSEYLADADRVVSCHHERYDGSGYPRGLAGKAIPLEARLFTIVDVFDALTTRRPYKEALTVEQAQAMMDEQRGRQFDPDLLDQAARHLAEFASFSRLSDRDLTAILIPRAMPYLMDSVTLAE